MCDCTNLQMKLLVVSSLALKCVSEILGCDAIIILCGCWRSLQTTMHDDDVYLWWCGDEIT
jgi:hypothetical protein